MGRYAIEVSLKSEGYSARVFGIEAETVERATELAVEAYTKQLVTRDVTEPMKTRSDFRRFLAGAAAILAVGVFAASAVAAPPTLGGVSTRVTPFVYPAKFESAFVAVCKHGHSGPSCVCALRWYEDRFSYAAIGRMGVQQTISTNRESGRACGWKATG